MEYRHAVKRIVAVIDSAVAGTFPDRDRIYIANPHAGTHYRHHRTVTVASHYHDGAVDRDLEIYWTESPKEAREVIRALSTPTIVVSLGGDGTHNHCLRAGMEVSEGISFLRVPLGSGNDAGATASLKEFLAALHHPLRERPIPAVRVFRNGRENGTPEAAFNIASVGIDAFITAMHDKWRAILPGNTYRLLVNLAVLRYERLVNLGPSRLKLSRSPGERSDATAHVDDGMKTRILIAMGVSGNRTYGDHMRVLPGEENVCVLGTASLRDKFRMKRLFYAGRHVDEDITTMHSAKGIEIEYDGPMPLQMDGEAMWLQREDFPLRMEIRTDAVSIIDPE